MKTMLWGLSLVLVAFISISMSTKDLFWDNQKSVNELELGK